MKTKKRKGNTYAREQLIVMLVVLVLMMASLAAAFVWLYRPGGLPGSDLPFSTETVKNPGGITVPPSVENPGTTGGGSSSGPIYTPRDEVYNFLIVGHDRVATLADVIMLVNYDVPAGKIAIMQLPRDTYFEGDSSKPSLNVQFSAYYNRAFLAGDKNPAATAAEKFAETLEKSLCINIHYTAVMNLDGFAGIVNALGGVDIDIPYDMDYEDPEQKLYIHFKKGPTHLDGEEAEHFVRFRDSFVQADIGRGNAQKIFMTAFIEQAKKSISLSNVSLLSSLASEVVKNLTTDVTAPDIVYFAKNALKIDLSVITMLTIPGDGVYGYYVANRADTLKAINAYFNVYDHDITDSIFDPNCVFSDEKTDAIHKAYTAPSAALNFSYTAEEIDQQSINIPMKQGVN